MKKINVMAAVNPLGYGVAGLNILKELDKIADVTLFPIGQPQPTTQEDADLVQKLTSKQSDFDPAAPCVKIWHEHSLAERIGKGKYYGFPIFELNKFDQRRIKNLECCDEVMVCSQWAKDIVVNQTGRDEKEIKIVPLGVDRSIFNESKSNVSGTQFVLFNCGKWEVRKGHDVLFRAFKMAFPDDVRDVKLFMMCDNPFPQAKQQADQFQNMYGSDVRVKFVPRVNTSEEVAQIMGQADCGVFPARGEGWNLELLEMMSMGKPVIATNYSGHTQFCDALNCALVDIEKTEPAFDGVWFDGKVGEWASLDQNQIQQLANHMKVAYETWKREGPITNPAGIETANKFTWAHTAERILGTLL